MDSGIGNEISDTCRSSPTGDRPMLHVVKSKTVVKITDFVGTVYQFVFLCHHNISKKILIFIALQLPAPAQAFPHQLKI